MRFPTLLSAAFAALCFLTPATAQDKFQVFGGNGERKSSVLLAFGQGGGGGGIALNHGQPKWKDEYDKMVANPGSMAGPQRLGKDWWTAFDTTVALDFGGTKIPAGSYVLGLEVSKEGKVSLLFIDSSKAMKSMMPFDASTYKADFSAPLELQKNVAKENVELMTISVTADKADPTNVTFTIAWGKHALVGKIKADFGGKKEASAEKGKK